MCLFARKTQPNSLAYKRGVYEFACGVCPECLSRRSRYWALRACMEAKTSPACMVTLTYDNYLRDSKGRVIGELPPNRELHVSKRDVQLFIKRLRRAFPQNCIKYIATAEYGSHTHRAHYHLLLFGVVFNDLIVKGRSKRGNLVYRSNTLSRIWANASKDVDWRTLPICTVDSVLVGPAVARYCTKYCSKDSGRAGGDDTFMLFSRGIGEAELLRTFNGRSYIIDGREYPIPRTVWQKYISACYDVDFRYVAPKRDYLVKVWRARNELDGRFISQCEYKYCARRHRALVARDADPTYQSYISYWKAKNDTFELTRPSPFVRLRSLPDSKYRFYKAACMNYFSGCGDILPPRSSERAIYQARFRAVYRSKWSFAFGACHYTANDTNSKQWFRCFVPDRYFDIEIPPDVALYKEVT